MSGGWGLPSAGNAHPLSRAHKGRAMGHDLLLRREPWWRLSRLVRSFNCCMAAGASNGTRANGVQGETWVIGDAIR